jgi:hypothetical protein
MNRVGNAPAVIDQFKLECPEYMYVQYMPVCMAGVGGCRIPDNLKWLETLVYSVILDEKVLNGKDYYVYVTAKCMYVEAGAYPNRPQWHIDGYGTDDLNFIWYDSSPTEFCVQPMILNDDHEQSILQMRIQAHSWNIATYPANTLLRLDNTVVHRVAPAEKSGFRTFVKVSVSKHQYNLKGNAHNYLFDYTWDMQDRAECRNHPVKG